MEDMSPGLGFEILPETIGPHDEGDVIGPFGIGVAKDASLPGMRAAIVHETELLDDERTFAESGEFPRTGKTHRTAAEDDDIVVVLQGKSIVGAVYDRAFTDSRKARS